MVRRLSFVLAVPVLLLGRVTSPQGNPVGPQFRVNTYTTGTQMHPEVAVDSAGDFVVAWESSQEPFSGIFGQRYAASGVPLGPEFHVNTYTTSFQSHPSLASDPSGNFLVAWDGYGSSGDAFEIFAQRYDSSGVTLGTEFRVNTWTTGGQQRPAVAANPDGTFVVVWSGGSPGLGIVGQRYAASGAPIGPEFLVSTQVGEGYPAVASDALGNFVVVWERYTGGGTKWEIFGRRCDSTGGALGPEFRVNTYTTSVQRRPSVASDAAGSFVIVWDSDQSAPAANWDVFGQRFAGSGAPLGSEFRVNADTLWDQAYATAASDTSGNFVVVWTGFPPGVTGIQGQRYSSSGAPLGQNFTVAPAGEGPDAAVDGLGNFVVVWHSYQEDGSNYGVFGQRYNQIVPVELMHFQVE